MWPCRTRPSTSPMETSPSTSAPRSSPAATSPRRSPRPCAATSTSRRASARASRTSSSAWASGTGRKVRFTGALVGEWLDSRTKRRGALPRLARPHGQVRPPRGAPARTSGQSTPKASRRRLARLDRHRRRPLRQRPEGIDPRGRRDARRAPGQGPARALRHGRALRASADRGGARHLSPAPPGDAFREVHDDHPAQPVHRGHRGPRPPQVVRQAGRPRRHRPRGPRGHRVRPARPERRRQDDDHPHPRRRCISADARRGPHRRPRRRARAGRRSRRSSASPARCRRSTASSLARRTCA